MNIDYTLLDKQVLSLLNLRFNPHKLTKNHRDSLDGVIELLETIQDNQDKQNYRKICKNCKHWCNIDDRCYKIQIDGKHPKNFGCNKFEGK